MSSKRSENNKLSGSVDIEELLRRIDDVAESYDQNMSQGRALIEDEVRVLHDGQNASKKSEDYLSFIGKDHKSDILVHTEIRSLNDGEKASKKNEDWAAKHHEADINDQNMNREMRIKYANKVYVYLCLYSVFSAFTIWFQGFGGVPHKGEAGTWIFFHLDNVPFSILIGSTAVSAIGLVAIVLRGLFRPPLKEKRKKKALKKH